jgi:HlyD family secretion protein
MRSKLASPANGAAEIARDESPPSTAPQGPQASASVSSFDDMTDPQMAPLDHEADSPISPGDEQEPPTLDNGRSGPNGPDGRQLADGQSGRRWWRFFYLLLIGAIASYVWFVFVPSFKSPRSRVYTSALGYPAVMRLLEQPIDVQVDTVYTRSMNKTFSAEGHIGYLNEVPVRTEVLGVVTAILAEPGQEVKKGDVLVRINTGGFTTRLQELLVQQRQWEVEQARATLARVRKMYQGNAASAQDLELAQLAVHDADSILATAREQYKQSMLSRSRLVEQPGLRATELEAPAKEIDLVANISGTVFQRNVQPGENIVLVNDPLMVIGDQVTFLAAFDQRYAGAIQKGDRGNFYLRAYPGVVFEGEVVRLSHHVEPEDQKPALAAMPWVPKQPPDTFYAWLALRGTKTGQKLLDGRPEPKLLYGMNGYCVFQRPYSALAVPESALMRYSGRTGMVFVVDGTSHLQIRNVTFTGVDEGWVAIESGLNEGETVVLDGQIALKPGDSVIPRRD